ncbi:unnamed protein product [Spirodela intermedia]|uniref:Uncharacterized protein n=1 Tax=Spirodela intermedia TaxID=51605 RepID=A0A7I8KQN9_SPIIN|nr:unnamed protein product [Spirodela intermedia]
MTCERERERERERSGGASGRRTDLDGVRDEGNQMGGQRANPNISAAGAAASSRGGGGGGVGLHM